MMPSIPNISLAEGPWRTYLLNWISNIKGNVKQTSINGSTSGSVLCSQPVQGSAHKRVVLYCLALQGTATYTFPLPFIHTPQILSQSLSAIVTAASTSFVSLNGSAAVTGVIELSGL